MRQMYAVCSRGSYPRKSRQDRTWTCTLPKTPIPRSLECLGHIFFLWVCGYHCVTSTASHGVKRTVSALAKGDGLTVAKPPAAFSLGERMRHFGYEKIVQERGGHRPKGVVYDDLTFSRSRRGTGTLDSDDRCRLGRTPSPTSWRVTASCTAKGHRRSPRVWRRK